MVYRNISPWNTIHTWKLLLQAILLENCAWKKKKFCWKDQLWSLIWYRQHCDSYLCFSSAGKAYNYQLCFCRKFYIMWHNYIQNICVSHIWSFPPPGEDNIRFRGTWNRSSSNKVFANLFFLLLLNHRIFSLGRDPEVLTHFPWLATPFNRLQGPKPPAASQRTLPGMGHSQPLWAACFRVWGSVQQKVMFIIYKQLHYLGVTLCCSGHSRQL